MVVVVVVVLVVVLVVLVTLMSKGRRRSRGYLRKVTLGTGYKNPH
jgi:hypothetical protein